MAEHEKIRCCVMPSLPARKAKLESRDRKKVTERLRDSGYSLTAVPG